MIPRKVPIVPVPAVADLQMEMVAVETPIRYHPDTRWYVLARTRDQFKEWARTRARVGVVLSRCVYVDSVDSMRGFDFTSPLRQLMILNDWTVGGDARFVDAGYNLIARYCRDKGVHAAPCAIV